MNTFLAIGECMVEMASVGDGVYRQGFAGDSFNTSWHARRALPADWDVAYFSAVGDDPISSRMLDFMVSQNVSTRHVKRIAGKSPGLYLIDLKDGERSFSYWRSASAARHLADDEAALNIATSDAKAIFFTGVTLAIVTPDRRKTLLDALRVAKARGSLVAFDSNIRMRLWQDAEEARQAVQDAATVSTMVLVSGDDERALFGVEDIAARYRGAGITEIVIKEGAEPVKLWWADGKAEIAPEQGITPVDTTGAGDSFNGTYLAARLTGVDPITAVRQANQVAARVIQNHGALV